MVRSSKIDSLPISLLEDSPFKEVRQNFIDGAGRIAVSLLGILNRICGQIYALLYLSPHPLSLDDIVAELGVSKGNVSINIRLLEDYKLVKKVWIKGSRKDYYEALDTLPQKIIREFFEKIKRNIQDSLDMIHDCEEMASQVNLAPKNKDQMAELDFLKDRLQKIRSFYENATYLFEAIYSGQQVDTQLLKPILEST